MSIPPTKKQQEVLRFIRNFAVHERKPPTFREIGDNLGISVGAAQERLLALQKKGLVSWVPGKPRSIQLRDLSRISPSVPVPLLGTISAGEGIAIHEEEEPEIIDAPSYMLTSGFGHYCLRVSGFSMAEDGIIDGDIIVVRQQASANDGDTVVAAIKENPEERATLKKFYRQGNQIELRPKNQQLHSKFYTPSQIEIRGKFRGLIRRGGE